MGSVNILSQESNMSLAHLDKDLDVSDILELKDFVLWRQFENLTIFLEDYDGSLWGLRWEVRGLYLDIKLWLSPWGQKWGSFGGSKSGAVWGVKLWGTYPQK